MIKKFNIVILVRALFFIALSSCNKESSLPIQNENQNSTNELKSLVSQVKFWHDSVISNKVPGGNSENNIKSFSQGPDDISPPSINWELAYKNFDSANKKSITIPLSLNTVNGEFLQLVIMKYKDSIGGIIIKSLPDNSYLVNSYRINDYLDYSGSVSIFSMKGKYIKNVNIKTGAIQSHSTKIINKTGIKINSDDGSDNFCQDAPCNLADFILSPGYRYMSFGNFASDWFIPFGFDGYGYSGLNNDDYQFPLNSDYAQKYPKFTQLIKNIYQNSRNTPHILDWLKAYSHMDNEQIFKALEFNKGPTIVIKDVNAAPYNGPSRYAYFDSKQPDIINVDIKTINNFEINTNFARNQAFITFLAGVILHESVHYGNNLNKFSEFKDGKFYDYGDGFEISAYGSTLTLIDK